MRPSRPRWPGGPRFEQVGAASGDPQQTPKVFNVQGRQLRKSVDPFGFEPGSGFWSYAQDALQIVYFDQRGRRHAGGGLKRVRRT